MLIKLIVAQTIQCTLNKKICYIRCIHNPKLNHDFVFLVILFINYYVLYKTLTDMEGRKHS
jgi:hypothetical protein